MAKKKKRYGYQDGDENARFAPGGNAASEWEEQHRQSFTMGRTINSSGDRFNTDQDIENYKPIKTETYQSYMASKLAQAKANNPKSKVHITANDLSSYSNARAKLFNIDPTANLKSQSEFTSDYKSSVDKKARLNDMVQLAQGLDLGSAQDLLRKSYNDLGAVEGLANTRTNAEGLLKRVEEYRKLYGDSKELKVLEDRAKGIQDYINANAKGGSAVSNAVFEEAQAPITKSIYDTKTQTKDEVRAKYKAISDANIEEKYGKPGNLGYEGVKNIKAQTPAEADWKEEKQLQLDPFKKYEDNKKEIESLENDGKMPLGNQNGVGYKDEQEAKNDRINALREQNAQILSQYAEDIIAKANLTDDERRKLETGRSFDLSDNEFRWDVGDKAKNEVTLNRKEMIGVLTKRGISEEEASLLLDYEKELDKENERQAAINAGELRRRTDSELGNLTEDIVRTIGQPIISPLERVMGVSGEYAHAEQLGRQQAREKYYEDDAIGKALYDFGETAGTIVGSSLLGGAAAVPFTTKAVEDSYYNALDKGATESDAMNYAATNGIMTGIIYGIGLKGVNKLLSKSVKGSVVEGLAKEIVEGKPTSSLGKAIIKNVGTNALKEGGIFAGLTTTTQVADTLNQVVNLGKKSDFNQMVEAYKQQGMSEDEAWQNTVLDISKQIGQGALESFASGAIMGAGGALIGMTRPYKVKEEKPIFDENGNPVIDKETGRQKVETVERTTNQLKEYNPYRERAEALRGEFEHFTTDKTSPYFENITDNAELESQFKQRAKELHPDVAEGNEEAFRKLVEDKERIEGILTGDYSKDAKVAIDNWENFVNQARDILGLERVLTTKEREGFVNDYEDIKTKLLETKTEVEKSNADQVVKDEVINNIDNEIARVDTAVEATADIVVPEENAIGKSKSGKPIYIDEVNGTDVTFVDSEGKKVTDYELDDTPQTELMELAIDKDYNTDTTKSMMKGFELANTDNVEAYADNYDVFYAAGKDSSIKNFKDALAKAPELTSALEIVGTDAAGKAFSEGRKQISPLQQKGLTKLPKGKFTNDTGKTNAATEYAEMFAIFSGGDVIATENPEKFISSKVEPGSIRGVYIEPEGKIIIDTKYTSFIRALNHEGKHLTDNFAIDEAKIVSDACMNYARNELGIKGIDDAIKNLQDTYEANGQKISYSEAQSEFINNIVGTAMASPEGIEGLVGEFAKDEKISDAKKQSIISKFIEWIKNLIARLKVYAKEGGAYEDTEFVSNSKEQRQDIVNKQIDALKASRKILEEISAELKGTTDTSEQFSFAGTNSKTADLSMLDKAQQLTEEGKSKEKIFKETGWFKGQDGKWRYEIDDSKVKVKEGKLPIENAKLSDVISAPELFKAYPFLKNIKFDIINFLSNSLGQFSETENTISLNSDFFENSYAIKRRKEILNSEEYKKHSDILTKIYEDSADKIKKAHSELLRANELDLSKDENVKKVLKATDKYNNLKSERDEKVNKEQLRFNDTEAGVELLELSNDMSVDSIKSYKADEAKEVILHEIQHAIQRAENFATGASPSYWRDVNQYLKGMTKYDEAIFNQLNKKRLDLVKKIKKEFNLEHDINWLKKVFDVIRSNIRAYEDSLNMKSNIYDKYDKERYYSNIQTNLKDFKIPRKAIYKYMDIYNTISDEMSAIRDNALERTEKDAFRLYQKTAGEIESRDTESRSNLSAEERRNTYPESAKPQEVYFAGKGDLNKSAKYSLTEKEEKLISDYDKAVKDNDMEKAAELVKDYAASKGYTQKVYHGTESFGFTQIDLTRSDDNMTFWATDDIETAQTYSNAPGTKRISEQNKDINNLTNEEIINEILDRQESSTTWYHDYSDAELLKANDIEARLKLIEKINENVETQVDRVLQRNPEDRTKYIREDYEKYKNKYSELIKNPTSENTKATKLALRGLETSIFEQYYNEKIERYSAPSVLLSYNDSLKFETLYENKLKKDLFFIDERIYEDKDTPLKLLKELGYNSGNYEFYANTSDFLEVDAGYNNWNKIEYTSDNPTIDNLTRALKLHYDPFGWEGAEEIDYNEDTKEFTLDYYGYNTLTLSLDEAKDFYKEYGLSTTREIAFDALNKNYKGVKISHVKDNGGRAGHQPDLESATVYIFFNPVEQVKSADPITYDDNGNVIPLQERFSKDHNDIRYSVENNTAELVSDKDEELEVDTREKALVDANKELVNALSELKENKLDESEIRAIASSYKKNFNVDLTTKTVAEELKKVVDAVVKSKANINAPEVNRVAEDFIKNILRNSKGEIQEDNARILSDIKKTPIKLSEGQKKEIDSKFGSYNSWRKSNMGNLTIRNEGISLDSQWVEWSDMYPAIFDSSISDADEPLELDRIISSLKDGIPFDNRPEAIQSYKAELLKSIADGFKLGGKRLQYKFARLERLITKDYKQRIRDALKEQRTTDTMYFNRKLSEMRSREKLRKKEQDIRKETTKVRQNNIKAIGKLKRMYLYPTNKSRIPTVLQGTVGTFLESIDPSIFGNKLAKYQKQIDKLTQQLSNTTGDLYTQTANQLQDLIAKKNANETAFIKLAEDYENKREELKNIGEFSEALAQSLKELAGKMGFSNTALEDMNFVMQKFGGRNIQDFDLGEQKLLNKVLKMLTTEIENYNRIIDASIIAENGQALHISDVVEKGVNEIESVGARQKDFAFTTDKDPLSFMKKVYGKALNTKLSFTTKNLRPDVLLSKTFGFHKNNTGDQIFNMLLKGYLEYKDVEMKAKKMLEKPFKDKKDKEYIETLQKYDDKNLYDIGATNDKGEPVKVPKAFAIQLKRLLNNPLGREHIMGDGLIIPNVEQYYKNRKGLDSLQQVVNGIDPEVIAYNKNIAKELSKDNPDFDKIKEWDNKIDLLTSESKKQIAKIEAQLDSILTEWDKDYIENSYDIFDGFLKKKLNEKTQLRFGYDGAQVEKYTRFVTDPDSLASYKESGYGVEQNMEAVGFMQRRTGARNALILEDALIADKDQIGRSAEYIGFMIPQHNLNRILKYTAEKRDAKGELVYGADNKPVKMNITKAMRRNYPEALDYIEDLKLDLFGGKPQAQHGFIANLGMAVTAQQGLVGNVGVEAMQTSSHLFAASEISFGSLLKALVRGGKNKHPLSRADRELIDKYSPLLWDRDPDNMQEVQAAMNDNILVGRLYRKMANNKALSYVVARIPKFDNATVGRSWYASEFDIKKDYPNLKVGSEEYYKKVAELFNSTVIKAHPMYSALFRNEYQRSNNAVIKMLEMFKTVLAQQMNTVYLEVGRYNAYRQDYKNNKAYNTTEKDVKKQGRKMRRTIAAFFIATSYVWAIASGVSALLYHKKPSEWTNKDGDVELGRVLKSYVDKLVGTYAGAFLLGSDLMNAVNKATDNAVGYGDKYHYDFSLNVVDVTKRLFDIIGNMGDLNSDNPHKKEQYIENATQSLMGIFGLPYRNTKKFVTGVAGIVEDFADNGEFDYSNELEGSQELRKWAKGELGQDQVKDSMTTQKVGNAVKKVYLDKDITKEQAVKKLEESGLYKGTKNRSLSSVLEGKVEKWDIDKYKDEYLATLTSGGAETAESRAVIKKITSLPYSNAFYSDSSRSHYKNYKSSYEKLLEHIKKWKKSEQ